MVTVSHLIRLGAHHGASFSPYVNLSSRVQDGVKNVKKKSTWNYRSERVHHNDHVLGKRNNQKIYDLDQTIVQLRSGLKLVQEIRRKRGSVLFVLPQTDAKIKKQLKALNQYYICDGWIGGLLTNFSLFSLRQARESEDYYIPSMPDAVVLLNSNTSINRLVVQETYQLNIPLVALLPSHSKIPYPIASRTNSRLILSFYRSLFVKALLDAYKS